MEKNSTKSDLDFSKPSTLNNETEESIRNFGVLLDSLGKIEEKEKILLKQIHQNAVTDRKNAMLMWNDLYMHVHNNEENHFKHGAILAKYMERSEKANEQLIKLAGIIDKYKESDGDKEDFPSASDIFAKSERKFKKS